MPTIYTVGHSTNNFQAMKALLRGNNLTILIDVRSAPYSRINPEFNRETLKNLLRRYHIGYLWMGDRLGARSNDRACYVNGQVQYELLAKSTCIYAWNNKPTRNSA